MARVVRSGTGLWDPREPGVVWPEPGSPLHAYVASNFDAWGKPWKSTPFTQDGFSGVGCCPGLGIIPAVAAGAGLIWVAEVSGILTDNWLDGIERRKAHEHWIKNLLGHTSGGYQLLTSEEALPIALSYGARLGDVFSDKVTGEVPFVQPGGEKEVPRCRWYVKVVYGGRRVAIPIEVAVQVGAVPKTVYYQLIRQAGCVENPELAQQQFDNWQRLQQQADGSESEYWHKTLLDVLNPMLGPDGKPWNFAGAGKTAEKWVLYGLVGLGLIVAIQVLRR